MIRVLSIRQPWAWLIVNGWKDVEIRNWPTQFRGRFLVHAGKTMTHEDYQACRLFVAGFAPSLVEQIPFPAGLERGGIVGSATLTDCVRKHDSDWFCGDYGFVLTDAKPLPFRPCRGQLGFFTIPGGE
jgi:hypothetical protein